MAKRDCAIVVGGGAAGMMAALWARREHPEFKVILVEHQEKLGRKLLVCGAGRCNVTNVDVRPERFFGAAPEFVRDVLAAFDQGAIRGFFEEMGIPLYEEKKSAKGKLFPVTNQAQTVLHLLQDELEREGVEIRMGVRVRKAERTEDGFSLATSKGPLWCTHLLLACGGKTYPKLGGDGAGYEIARSFGHRIVEPVPVALPLEAPNPVSKRLHGVRAFMEAAARVDGEELRRDADQMMFMKYGFTGPVILNISRPLALRLHRERKGGCELELNFFPGRSAEAAREAMEARWKKRPRQRLSLSLSGLLQSKLPGALLSHLGIEDRLVEEVPAEERDALLGFLHAWRVPVTGTRGWDEGEFTAGGVDTAQVDPKTLGSKLVPCLYFAGELLDVDGDVGGFNLSWAWSSGRVAGKLR